MPRDERRTQILALARDLFATEGYHHVSMDDIALRAEVSKPVLYRHFPSKLDLYMAVIDQRGEDLVTAVEAALAPVDRDAGQQESGRAVVKAVVRAYFDFVAGAGEASSLLFESDLLKDPAIREQIDLAASSGSAHISRVLQDVSGLPAAQTELLVTGLTAMARSAATHHFRSVEPLDLEAAADLVGQLAWGGIAVLVRGNRPDDGTPRHLRPATTPATDGPPPTT